MPKHRTCKSGILLAALNDDSPDDFDPPLDEEQLKLYYGIQKQCRELEAEGKPFTIDISSEV